MWWATHRTIIVLETGSRRGGRKMMLEELVALRCLCSYGISVVLRGSGEGMCTIVFFDNEPASETSGERVRECPSCGERLGLHRLLPRSFQEG
jgi:hypothetical protein